MPPRETAASLKDVQPGGQGIRLMRAYATRLDYERREGRNRLRLGFDLNKAETHPV